jgi:hypothetical protein
MTCNNCNGTGHGWYEDRSVGMSGPDICSCLASDTCPQCDHTTIVWDRRDDGYDYGRCTTCGWVEVAPEDEEVTA